MSANPSPDARLGAVPPRDDIPARILRGRRWVGWRQVPRRTGKPAKPPIDPATGRMASPTDPGTWGTFAAARVAVERYGLAGVGRVVVPADGLTFLDLDECRDPGSGRPDPWAADILGEFADTYAEVSPSGTGYRLVVAGHPPPDTRSKYGAVECYFRDHYLTISGRRVGDHPITVAPDKGRLRWFAERYLRRLPRTPKDVRERLAVPVMIPDAELILRGKSDPRSGKRLAALLAGDLLNHSSRSEADFELAWRLGELCGGDADRVEQLLRRFGPSRDKWERKDYLPRTVQTALTRGYVPKSPLPPKTPTCEECAKRPRRPRAEQNQQLIALIRRLRVAQNRPVFLSGRNASAETGIPARTAARRLAELVQGGAVLLLTPGAWDAVKDAPGPASVYDLPEFAPARPIAQRSPRPKAGATGVVRKPRTACPKGTVRRQRRPSQLPPYTCTRVGLVPVWRWSVRSKCWLHFGDCPGRAAADALAGRLMTWRAGWWAVGGDLMHYSRGRGLRVFRRGVSG